MRRLDLPAVATEIRVAQIVGENNDDIGTVRRGGERTRGKQRRRRNQGEKRMFHSVKSVTLNS